ncbi:MAG: cytochrome c [Bacteroidetes bacterium]|nr:cytochrome c [Bacteroidota bacterium]
MRIVRSSTLMCILFVLSAVVMSQISPKPVKQRNKLAASIERGKKVYADQCLTCHQADGLGVQNMNPPLVKTKWVLGDKKQLIEIVLKGKKDGVEIDGDSYSNVMASHADLTDLQIADVLTYVRNSFGNKAKAITEAEVKTVRAKLK